MPETETAVAETQGQDAGRINGRFAKGFSGNPGGMRKGYRSPWSVLKNHLAAEAICAKGRASLRKLRDEQPAAFWGVVARVMPKSLPEEIELALELDAHAIVTNPDELSRTFTAQIEAVRKQLRTLPAAEFVDSGDNGHGGNGHA